MVRLPRLKNNPVDRRKSLNLQKNFNDQHDCHEWPQDLIRFDWMTTLSRRWRPQFQSGRESWLWNPSFTERMTVGALHKLNNLYPILKACWIQMLTSMCYFYHIILVIHFLCLANSYFKNPYLSGWSVLLPWCGHTAHDSLPSITLGNHLFCIKHSRDEYCTVSLRSSTKRWLWKEHVYALNYHVNNA